MCEFDVEFGSEQCEGCPRFRYCKEYDDFSQQEECYREMYQEDI